MANMCGLENGQHSVGPTGGVHEISLLVLSSGKASGPPTLDWETVGYSGAGPWPAQRDQTAITDNGQDHSPTAPHQVGIDEAVCQSSR